MPDDVTTYNLLDEGWIPVLYHTGEVQHLGIRDTLRDAHRIRTIAAGNPMDRVAVLRFLLAVKYWCRGNPDDADREAARKGFPMEWFDKLEEHRECFNLLGDGKRFLQYGGYSKKDTLLPVNYLMQEVPTGSNANHFRHAHDKADGLCLDCCALGLLRLPAFATSGGRGKPPGINSKPPVYAIPASSSLCATLLANWQHHGLTGDPAWLDPAMMPPVSGTVSLLCGLTWVPRRVWIQDPGETEETCIACAKRKRLVKKTVYAAIGSTKGEEGLPMRTWSDPHVIYGEEKKGVKLSFHARDCLGSPDASADQWHKLLANVLCQWSNKGSGQSPVVQLTHLMLVGFSTVQNDKYLEAVEWHLPYELLCLITSESLEAVSRYQAGASKFSSQLSRKHSTGSNRKSAEIPAILANIKPHAEHEMHKREHELISADADGWKEAAQDAYGEMIQAAIDALIPRVAAHAERKRRQLSSLAPEPAEPKRGKAGRKMKIFKTAVKEEGSNERD